MKSFYMYTENLYVLYDLCKMYAMYAKCTADQYNNFKSYLTNSKEE